MADPLKAQTTRNRTPNLAIPKQHGAVLANVLLDEQVDFKRVAQLIRLDPAMCAFALHHIQKQADLAAHGEGIHFQAALERLGRVKLWKMLSVMPVLEEHCTDVKRVTHYLHLRHVAVLAANLAFDWAVQQRRRNLDAVYLSTLLHNMGALLDIQEGVVTLVAESRTAVSRQVELRFSEAWGLPQWLKDHLSGLLPSSDAMALAHQLARSALRQWGGEPMSAACQAAAVMLKRDVISVRREVEHTAARVAKADAACPIHHLHRFYPPQTKQAVPVANPTAAPQRTKVEKTAVVQVVRPDRQQFQQIIRSLQAHLAEPRFNATQILQALTQAMLLGCGFTRAALLAHLPSQQAWKAINLAAIDSRLAFDASLLTTRSAPLLLGLCQSGNPVMVGRAQQHRLQGQLPKPFLGNAWAQDMAFLPMTMADGQSLVLFADTCGITRAHASSRTFLQFAQLGQLALQALHKKHPPKNATVASSEDPAVREKMQAKVRAIAQLTERANASVVNA